MTRPNLPSRVRLFLGLALLIVSIGIFALPREVSAHAELVSADPPPDTIVEHLPSALVLTFSEPVDVLGDGIVILAPSGRIVQPNGALRFDDDRTTVVLPLSSHDELGTYRVRYSVIGLDGHLVTGSYTFSVGYPSRPADALPAIGALTLLQALTRFLQLLGLTALGGGLLLGVTARGTASAGLSRSIRRSCSVGALFVATASLVMLAALVILAGDGSLAQNIRVVALSRSGILWFANLALALGLLATSALPVPPHGKQLGWAIGAGALALVRALEGHAVTAPLAPLSIAIAAFHTATGTALLGSSILLPVVLRTTLHGSDRALAVGTRLLRRWLVTVLLISEPALLSGAYVLWVNVHSPIALGTTWYGRLLFGKLLLLAILTVPLLLSLPRWFRSRTFPWSALRLTGLPASLALVLAGSLSLLAPARAPAPARTDATGLQLAQNAGPYLVTLTISPARPGLNRIAATVSAPNGQPIDDAEVTVALQTAEGPQLVRLERRSATYHASLALSADTWDLSVYVTRPGEDAPPPARFVVPIPVPDGLALLRAVDSAMNALQTVEERTRLTSGGPVVETIVQYRAPDRAAYTVTTPGRPTRETIIIDRTRYDRAGMESWTEQPWPGSQPFRWPSYRYADTAEEVRILGIETIDGTPCYQLSFRDAATNTFFRLWVSVTDLRIRRYEMMATGHYMTGEFARFDDPTIVITPPPTRRDTALR